jgi:FkbM family methyltransferase
MTEEVVDEKFQRGFREKDAFADQLKLKANARVIFDVGANQGQTSKKYRALFPKARIHAFEPFPKAFKVLEHRYREDPDIICAQVALGAAPGTRQFFTYEASVTNSLMPFADEVADLVPMATDLNKVIDVEGVTLDDYCVANDIDHIDILKMDTQGAELEILHGAKRMLSENRISLIYSEHIFVPLYDGQAEFYEVVSALAHVGFSVFDFYSFVYASSGQLKWGDAIYLKSKGKG